MVSACMVKLEGGGGVFTIETDLALLVTGLPCEF